MTNDAFHPSIEKYVVLKITVCSMCIIQLKQDIVNFTNSMITDVVVIDPSAVSYMMSEFEFCLI